MRYSIIKSINKLIMSIRNKFAAEPKSILNAIVLCLNTLIGTQTIPNTPTTIFNIKSTPSISLSDYLQRMFRYMNSSISSFVYSLILLDRLQQYNPQLRIDKNNIYRLLLVANVVSTKYLEDAFYKNTFYANVGGVSLKVLNQLECEFLNLINFNCEVGLDTFAAYWQRLQIFVDVNHKEQQQNSLKISSQRQQVLNKQNCAVMTISKIIVQKTQWRRKVQQDTDEYCIVSQA